MRSDVKTGVALSGAVVLLVGGYLMIRGNREAPITIASGDAKSTATTQTANPSSALPNKPAGPLVNRSSRANPNAKPGTTTTPGGPASNSSTLGRENRAPNRTATSPNRPTTSSPPNGPLAGGPSPISPAGPNARKDVAASPTDGGLARSDAAAKPPVVPAAGRSTTQPSKAEEPAASGSTIPMEKVAATPPANSVPIPLTSTSPASDKPSGDSGSTANTGSTVPNSPAFLSQPPESKPADAIPPPSRQDAAAVETHKVQPGDTMASLAQKYYGDKKFARFLREANKDVSDPDRLAAGLTIRIPPSPPANAMAQGPNAANSPNSAGQVVTTGGKRTYKVQPGDSFYRIAKNHLGNANRWKEVYDLNKSLVNNDPTLLKPGQMVILPDS